MTLALRGRKLCCFLALFLLGTIGVAKADDKPADAGPAALADQVSGLSKQVQETKLASHNAWLLTAAAFALLATGPGLALFYGGQVRKKNVLGVMMQCIFLMGLNSLIWALWGYSLAFGGDPGVPNKNFNPWIGNADFVLLRNVERSWDEKTNTAVTPMYSDSIPRLTHMLLRGMFFIIAPALICGAFAERMKFSTMVVFSVLWGTLVYCPLAHWVWGGGILQFNSEAAKPFGGGALDFAGGMVVQTSAGVSALVCALLIGRRLGHGSDPMPPHNLTYTAVGAALLWFGWFGFTAGSQLQADGIASSAFAATLLSAAAGLLAWASMEWFTRGKPSVLGACSSAVAGLVAITAGCGCVNPLPAIFIGATAGVVCFLACTTLKAKFRYDDSLDAFGVHGVGGTLGVILTGVLATRAVTDAAHGQPLGLLEGGPLLKGQLIALAVTWVLAIVATFIILKVLDATLGLRVSQQEEIQGLDVSQHGEEGYIFV